MQQGEFNPDEVRLLFLISKKLLTERSYGELLDDILGVTIDGLGAERGCVIVRHDGQLRAATARNFGAGSLEHAEREISGSIADSVLGAGKTLLLDDALHSQEFRGKPRSGDYNSVPSSAPRWSPAARLSQSFTLKTARPHTVSLSAIGACWMRSVRWQRQDCAQQWRCR